MASSAARRTTQEVASSTASREGTALLRPAVAVKHHVAPSPESRKNPATFFALVFLLSSPLYVLTALACLDVVGFPELGGLYISVATAAPFLAAYILTRRASGRDGIGGLYKKSFAVRCGARRWYAVAALLGPLRFALSYAAIRLLPLGGEPAGDIPPPMAPAPAIPAVFLFCCLLATGEEVGWMGYAFDSMRAEASGRSLPAALALGVVWALWHVPFFVFMFPRPKALHVGSEVVALIFDRVVEVWIYNNAAGSVVAVILHHAMDNVALLTFPDIKAVAPWGPALPCIFSVVVAVVVVSLWDSRTLTRSRFKC